MYDIEISTTRYKILNTGTIIVPKGEELEFKIDTLRFVFKFEINIKDGEKLKEPSFTLTTEKDSSVLVFKMVNMNNSFHATNTNTIEVATLKDEKLYLKFCVSNINKHEDDCDYLFNYTWYVLK